MVVKKAGTILIDKNNKKIALVHREKHNDYSFPKGHLEIGETIMECAIRETEEETKRKCKLIDNNYVAINKYFDKKNDECITYYYIALDDGVSDNKSLDTHEVVWVDFSLVRDKLTYENLKITWNEIKDLVYEIIKKY